MGSVEQDTRDHLEKQARAEETYDSLHDSELDRLVSDVIDGDCEKITLSTVLEGYNACDYSALIGNVCNASGDDLILARDALEKWITDRVREYCDDSDELDRRIWKRDQIQREGHE